jgi:hypothetical protein
VVLIDFKDNDTTARVDFKNGRWFDFNFQYLEAKNQIVVAFTAVNIFDSDNRKKVPYILLVENEITESRMQML